MAPAGRAVDDEDRVGGVDIRRPAGDARRPRSRTGSGSGPDTPPWLTTKSLEPLNTMPVGFAAGRRIGSGICTTSDCTLPSPSYRVDTWPSFGDPDEAEWIERHAPGVDEVGIDMGGRDGAVGHQVALLEAQAIGGLGTGNGGQRQGECERNAKLPEDAGSWIGCGQVHGRDSSGDGRRIRNAEVTADAGGHTALRHGMRPAQGPHRSGGCRCSRWGSPSLPPNVLRHDRRTIEPEPLPQVSTADTGEAHGKQATGRRWTTRGDRCRGRGGWRRARRRHAHGTRRRRRAGRVRGAVPRLPSAPDALPRSA